MPQRTLRLDAYTRLCLTALIVLLSLLVGLLYAHLPSLTPSAQAQQSEVKRANDPLAIPNAWAQRDAQTRVIEETNKKLDKIIDLLESGQIKIIAVPEDKNNDANNKK